LILELFVAAQGIAVIIGSALFILLDSTGKATLSAIAAGGSVFFSNLLMIFWIRIRRNVRVDMGVSGSVSILIVYFAKLVLTCFLLLAVVAWLPSIHWWGFLAGLSLALMAVYVVPFAARSQTFWSMSQSNFQRRAREIAGQQVKLTSR
jgi:F0F1-type ATP synthase assembly protein I